MKIVRISSLLMTLALCLYLMWMPRGAEALERAKVDLEQEKYQEAIEILKDQDVDPLILGNAYYLAGNALGDEADGNGMKKQELYAKALDTYEAGMVEEPQRIDLKYNDEYVKKQLENQQQDSSKDDSQINDSKQDSQENEKQNGDSEQNQQSRKEQGEDSDQSSQNPEDQNADDNQQNGESQNDSQEEEQQSSEAQDENQGSDNQDDGQQQGEEQTAENEQESSQGGEGQATGEVGEERLDDAMLTQVLKMLEDQEKDSLKNNQRVVNSQEEGGKNDW